MDDAASYLSQDRCELQVALKERARRMQRPTAKNMQALKRVVRFLKGCPGCLVVNCRQAEQQVVDVFSDSDRDRAGCAKTLRSTSSSYVMLGGHPFAASATTRNVVATSSGEAEFYALTKSASSHMYEWCHGVEGDSLTTRSGESATSPHPSLVGARGRWHAES